MPSGRFSVRCNSSKASPLKATAVFEVFPDFELGEYRRLRIPATNFEVTDQMVTEYLESLRHRHASYENLDPRPIADGDIAVATIEGITEDGTKLVDRKDGQYEVGHDDTPREISDALRGSVPGDTLEFEIAYPEDHGSEAVAGKTLKFRAEVSALQKRDLPDLDDEFATDVDNSISTLDDLRTRVREQMESVYQESAERAERQEAISKLAESHPMPLPRYYFASRVMSVIEEAKQRAGLGRDDPLPDRESALIQATEEVRVRAEQVLDRIASVEGISVSNSELEQEIVRYAQAEQITPERARRDLAQDGALANWQVSRLRSKALQFVIDEAERFDPREAQESGAEGESDSAAEESE